jgi:hypothetical protein
LQRIPPVGIVSDMNARTPAFERPAVKLAAFACTLGVTLGGGALIGAAIGPEPSESPAHADGGSETAGTGTPTTTPDGSMPSLATSVPEGLAVSRDGYTLVVATGTFRAGDEITLAFQIVGPDGRPVTAFDIDHDKDLHLIVVSRDLVDYLHVHPERAADGTWSITLPPRPAGSYRVFADFTPTGATSMTLGADIAVAGEYAPAALPAAGESAAVDGYDVTLDGTLVAGTDSTVTLNVADADGPVDDLEPYLGALGHLVAIRTGDLAYLHVHPAEAAEEPGGPDIEFTVEVPTPGTYRLFLDFSHGGDVRTAAFTVNAERGDHAGPAVSDAAPDTTTGHGHGDD